MCDISLDYRSYSNISLFRNPLVVCLSLGLGRIKRIPYEQPTEVYT